MTVQQQPPPNAEDAQTAIELFLKIKFYNNSLPPFQQLR